MTADPPKLRYPPIALTPLDLAAVSSVGINRGATFAAIWDGKNLVVHDLADGKEVWRHTLENPQRTDFNRRIAGVSDDGRRVVFHEDFKLTVVEHPDPSKPGPARQWVVRHQPVPGPLLFAGGEAAVDGQLAKIASRRSNTAFGPLSPDGRTLYLGPSSDTMKVWLLDLSADPQWASSDARPLRLIAVLANEGGGLERAVRDGAGNELYRFPMMPGGSTLHDERWLLTSNPRANPVPPLDELGNAATNRGAWQLQDVGGEKAVRLVASGVGEALMSADLRWLFVVNKLGVAQKRPGGRFRPHWTTTTIYRTATGEKVSEATAPPGLVFTNLRAEPGGKRWAVKTSPAPTPGSDEVGGAPNSNTELIPFSLRVYDTESGRELLAKDLGDSVSRFGSVTFSKDGQRAVVLSTSKFRENRVQIVGLADGAIVHSFTAASPLAFSFEGEVPDGKLILRMESEVQVWDPATGQRVHRLTGHSELSKVACSPDSRRLFVLDSAASDPRVHVWDLVTGRQLLSLPAPRFDHLDPQLSFTFTDGKLRYRSTRGERTLDGAPLPEPKQ